LFGHLTDKNKFTSARDMVSTPVAAASNNIYTSVALANEYKVKNVLPL
jgi:hypothetical protein